ncbi:MAG: rod-binding protein [Parvibaculum sp.]|uniref:rod-binding protein n=1 Tax=Parvibaculum sp. TaxID=2024848 RepID=UPI00284A2383|nr:rod-binding protein [Parvibaculum sp.]MDR3500566.1 rod-binding protein [Parvibaculum sp.]
MTIAALTAYGSQMPMAHKHANAQTWKTAQDFESSFLSTMTQTMFEGIKTDGAFGGGQGEATFRSLLIDQYGKEMTSAGGIGVADKIYGEILKMQEHGR